MAIQPTTEFAATSPKVIDTIIDDLRTSPRKYKVFEAIYGGGNKPKDAVLLASKTGLSEIAVLQLATPMAHKQYFEQVRNGKRVAFKKYPHINAVKHVILRSAKRAATLPDLTAPRTDRTARKKHPQRQVPAQIRTGRRAVTRVLHDVFVSHATEDKSFVNRLVKSLKAAGIKVWYDTDMLSWGDDLRRSIDRGLTNSRYGIVVFSKAFLKRKRWTEHELDGLFAKERPDRKVILPIWHNVSRKDLLAYSPSFADRIANSSKKDSIADIVKSLKALLKAR